MRTERRRFVLYTRLRDESLHHSGHRLNQRCIGCCESTGSFVSALVSPAAMVDTSACVPCLASALPPDSVSVLTLLMHFQGQCGFGVMRGISGSPRGFRSTGHPDDFPANPKKANGAGSPEDFGSGLTGMAPIPSRTRLTTTVKALTPVE